MADHPDVDHVYRFEPAVEGDDTSGVTLLVLHGATGDEHSLVDAARRLAPGAAVLSLRGSIDHPDGGYRHLPVRPTREELAEYDPDLPTPYALAVHARTQELSDFLAAVVAEFDRDPENVWLFGFSDGATAAASFAFDHPNEIEGAVVLSGREAFRPQPGRILTGKKVFCASGRHDDTIEIDDYEDLVEGLVSAGAEVELHWYDAGHEVPEAALVDARAWLGKRLAERDAGAGIAGPADGKSA